MISTDAPPITADVLSPNDTRPVLRGKTPRRARLSGASYSGGLLVSLWIAPIVAANVTVVAYVAPKLLPPVAILLSDSPVLAGPVVALVLWLLLGAAFAPMTSARNANSGSYADLQERLTQLNARLNALPKPTPLNDAIQEALSHCAFIAAELETAGSRWVTAAGYLALWKRLHRAEEALMEIEPRTQVVADALYDEWRLQNSNMQHGVDLIADLKPARQYLDSVAPSATTSIANEAEARAVARRVRFAINDFRDQRWAAIVRARNLLYGTMIMTELFAFALLGLAVIDRAPAAAIVAAIVFYLVGALVGLFNRLSQQATAGTMVEDYGLAWVRLILTPTLSGLAAVGGVVLTGMLTLSGLTGLVQPGSSGGTPSTVNLPVLADIFDLNKFRIGFLLAVVFGGTPILISNRLQQLTDQYKNDLKSTEATSGGTPAAPARPSVA
ncbi:MAG TPA: hypothetical protein VN973_11320 [Candidatus Dormibacteraeota bacterium]|nr:hypothetical protein [Candidatus Dormibacteraeota bacterium]